MFCMMIFITLLLFVVDLPVPSYSKVLPEEGTGTDSCNINWGNENIRESRPCSVANFRSIKSFLIRSTEFVLVKNDLCDLNMVPHNTKGRSNSEKVVAVQRGNCSFLAKAISATRLGYQAIVILNNEVGTFPFGESEDKSEDVIPTVMISPADLGNGDLAHCNEDEYCTLSNRFALSYGTLSNKIILLFV